MSWRLPAAIAFSALLHLVLIWAWRLPVPEPVDAASIEFEMLAIRPSVPDPPPEPEPERALSPEPDVPPEPPRPPETVAPQPSEETESVVAEKPAAAPQPAPAVVLNLSRPAIWESLVNPEPAAGPRSGLEFNPALSRGVADRVQERARIGLLSARDRAAYGLSEAVYGRTGAAGEVVKVDGQCFSLQETPELGSEPRWWMVKCLDAKTNPFEMAPLETDARGRAVAD